MTFTDGLTASAIILAVVAIASEILFFIVQTDRAAKSQREISDYVGQMREVLGKIEGLTTTTASRLDAITAQVVSGLFERLGQPPEAAGTDDYAARLDAEGWRVSQAAEILGESPTARAVVGYLAAGPRDTAAAKAKLVELGTASEGDIRPALDVASALDVLRALDLIAFDSNKKTVSLTAAGRQVAQRFSQVAPLPPSSGLQESGA